MTWSLWWLFVVTELALVLSPGPAVIYVFSRAAHGGFKSGLAANAGILSGNLIYFLLSATGVGAILVASATLTTAIRWFGAAFIIYLGLSMLTERALSIHKDNEGFRNAKRIFQHGLMLQMSNPKNLLFFVAILPLFINPQSSVALQVLILAVTSQVIEFVILVAYALLAIKTRQHINIVQFEKWVPRMGGILLVLIGITLSMSDIKALF